MPLLRPLRSFGAKLTLLVTITTGSAVVVASTVLAVIDYLDTEAETVALAGAQTNIIAVNSEAPLAFGDPVLGTEALAALKASPTVASAILFQADGRIFARYANPSLDAPGFPPGKPGIRTEGTWIVATQVVTGHDGELGRLQVTFDRSGALARAWGNVGVILIVAVMTVVFAFLFANRIGKSLVRPVGALAETARRVSETRDYSVRAYKYGEDELGQFTDVFNEMLAQIQKQDAEIQRAHDERQVLLDNEKKARVEIERASRMKDEFVATLSHELRTPLSAIMGWAHMLRSGDRPTEDVAKGMEVIERNARVQAQIIEDLLDMSRIVAGQLRLDVQQVNLSDVIEAAVTTVRPAAEAKSIRLQTVIDPGIRAVRGDPNRLQQIVWNLLSNAIKFTGRDGRVQVALERVNSHVEISVTDTGQGIAPEFLPHVFERFRQADGSTTRRHSGLGLGLAIVKQLVELHGGTVRARSSGDGKGSTFVVELPLMPIQEQPSTPERVHPRSDRIIAPQTDKPSLVDVRILLVDDEPDARELIGKILEEQGASVTRAGSALEALEVFQQQPPDVVISDIGMPDHDGYEFIRSVRKLEGRGRPVTPAIALTAFARSEDRTRAMLAGYQRHLSKPVEPAELLATVASVAGVIERARL
ncbi:MAG TPA: ATP-binding protein [Candidatus Binatia bacterium]|nr:ATP-binding protein [Candidatus Binatia bacterium]